MTRPDPSSRNQWKDELDSWLPLLGHRNWIAVTDAAYPAQSNHGVKTIATGEDFIDVLDLALKAIDESVHVQAMIYVDIELQYVTERDAPGVSEYRSLRDKIVQGRTIRELEHEKIISMLDNAGALFQVIVLKTNLAIPYSSVFLELGCGYWSSEAESRLRNSIAGHSASLLLSQK